MTLGLAVLRPGFLTTVQDLGRVGYRHLGVPGSGALDPESLQLANALVGNPPGGAALEMLYTGPRFEVLAETVRVALAGGEGRIAIAGGRLVPAWQSLTLNAGDAFEVLPDRRTSSSYLAIEGGIAVPLFLGSASTYLRGAVGGFEGRALKAGDRLPLALPCAPARGELRLPAPPALGLDQRVRVVLGPQQDRFTDAAIAALLESEFRVSPNADRMGMRLEGPLLAHRRGWDILSDAVPEGALQVPGSGQPILLLADHQTTGGYPKIATVVSADLAAAARRLPGDPLRFAAVAVEEAEALAREAARSLSALCASLEPVTEERFADRGRLYGENLISGVVTGRD